MGVIAKDKNKITLFYNSETSLGKETLPYVMSADNKLLAIDIAKTKVSGTQWTEIAEGLNLKVADLVDKKHERFTSSHGDSPFVMDTNSWIKVLQNQPKTLAFSVVIMANSFHAIKSSSEFIKLISPDNSNISKPYNEAK